MGCGGVGSGNPASGRRRRRRRRQRRGTHDRAVVGDVADDAQREQQREADRHEEGVPRPDRGGVEPAHRGRHDRDDQEDRRRDRHHAGDVVERHEDAHGCRRRACGASADGGWKCAPQSGGRCARGAGTQPRVPTQVRLRRGARPLGSPALPAAVAAPHKLQNSGTDAGGWAVAKCRAPTFFAPHRRAARRNRRRRARCAPGRPHSREDGGPGAW